MESQQHFCLCLGCHLLLLVTANWHASAHAFCCMPAMQDAECSICAWGSLKLQDMLKSSMLKIWPTLWNSMRACWGKPLVYHKLLMSTCSWFFAVCVVWASELCDLLMILCSVCELSKWIVWSADSAPLCTLCRLSKWYAPQNCHQIWHGLSPWASHIAKVHRHLPAKRKSAGMLPTLHCVPVHVLSSVCCSDVGLNSAPLSGRFW